MTQILTRRLIFWDLHSYSFFPCPIQSPWGAYGGLPLKWTGNGAASFSGMAVNISRTV